MTFHSVAGGSTSIDLDGFRMALPILVASESEREATVEPEVEADEAPARPRRQIRPAPARPDAKKQPPYHVLLLNDEDHTFEYVIELLVKVFGHPVERAFTLTKRIDRDGRASVWTGSKEVAELKRDQVRGYGPDVYASKTVRYPLGCVIEPAPQ